MISMKEARRRADRRLDRLSVQKGPDGTSPKASLSLLCIGTDVRGPELEDELGKVTMQLMNLLEAGVCECSSQPPELNCSSPALIAGVLAHTFWLGHEHGCVESR